MSLKAAFLILAGSVVLHVSPLNTLIILCGFMVCAYADRWLVERAMFKIVSEEMEWKDDKEHPEWQVSKGGGLTRIKLPEEHQAVVYRMGEMVCRILKNTV